MTRAGIARASSVLACALAVLVASSAPGSAVTAGTVVGATVASATSLNTSVCASSTAGSTHFGSMIPGSQAVTSIDCAVRFGSSNDTSQLRMAQADGVGTAMWLPTSGRFDAAYDGPVGGANGSFSMPIGAGSDVVHDSATQPDGKVVLGGTCAGPSNADACLARFNLDGSLDTTFDGPGAPGDGRFTFDVSGGSDDMRGVALQADGKVVIAGVCPGVGSDFCVARLTSSGMLDTTFDGPSGTGNGIVIVGAAGGQDARAVALTGDGRIVVGGVCDGTQFCALRLLPDGTLDTTFDGPGGNGNGWFTDHVGSGWGGFVTDMVLQSDGKVVLLGSCAGSGDMDHCYARYLADGSLDPSFDGPSGTANGKFLVAIGIDDYSGELTVQPDGKLVSVGSCVWGDFNMCVVRLEVDGSLDPGFDGPSGTANGRVMLPKATPRVYGRSIYVQPDGKLVAAGSCNWPGTLDMCVSRLLPNGAWDVDFDGASGTGNGTVTHAFAAGDDEPTDITVQPDGRFAVTGTCDNATTDVCVLSFDQAGSIDDYVTGGGADRDWLSGTSTSFFATCLRAVSGGATATWVASDPCPASDGAFWRAVPTSSTKVAFNAGLEPDPSDATAHLRFAMRASMSQPPGSYLAPITFEVLAPGT